MNFFIHRIFHTSFAILAVSLIAENALADQSNTHSPIPATLSGNGTVGPFITEALKQNPGLRAFDLRYQAARESIAFSGALPNPKAQLTHFVESIQTRTGPQRQAIQLQQPLPWLGKLNQKRHAAQAQAEAIWHAYAIQQFKLVDQVAEQTFDFAYLDKSITITNENISLLKRLESIVEDRVKSGEQLSDLLRLQVEIERYDDLVARQKAQRIAASANLESLLGRIPSKTEFNIEWNAPSAIQAHPSRWLAAISKQSPQIAILRSLEASQEARERLAKLAGKPDFSVGLNYIRTGDALNPSTPGNGKDPWALMVGVSLPIWRKANNALALQASLETEALSAQIENQELQLLAQGHSWIAKLEDAQNRSHRYDSKLMPLARQARDITESAYKAGKASILDLIETDRTLLKLETEYWRAVADACVIRWKLATLSGGLWLN